MTTAAQLWTARHRPEVAVHLYRENLRGHADALRLARFYREEGNFGLAANWMQFARAARQNANRYKAMLS